MTPPEPTPRAGVATGVVTPRPRTRLGVVLLASCALHVGLLAVVVAPRPTRAAVPAASADAWTGDTLIATDVEPAADPPPSPASPPPAPSTRALPPAPSPRVLPPAAALAPPPVAARPARAAAALDGAPAPSSPALASGPAGAATPRRAARPPDEPAAARSSSFGADGAPGVRSLARAFTRAIAPANQADPVWSSLAPGAAGSVDVSLALDEDGHLEASRATSDVTPALASLVRRTFALLRGGTYAARGGPTGAMKLRLTVRIRDVPAVNTPGGDVELDWTFDAGRGRASFLRDGGRRVDVTVELLR